jgi:enoyl-[acyl-carrier-protein] reductase (NADH)
MSALSALIEILRLQRDRLLLINTDYPLEELAKIARQRNPHKRLTVREDVARCITALCHPATYGMTGNTVHVDGGENVEG